MQQPSAQVNRYTFRGLTRVENKNCPYVHQLSHTTLLKHISEKKTTVLIRSGRTQYNKSNITEGFEEQYWPHLIEKNNYAVLILA